MSRWRSPASRALDGQRWRGAALWAASGAVAFLPLAVDMVLRPKAKPKTEAGKALQSVTDVVDSTANEVMRKIK